MLMEGLCRMALINFVAFAVLKILHHLVSMRQSCLQITAYVNKVLETVLCYFIFVFRAISGPWIGFA